MIFDFFEVPSQLSSWKKSWCLVSRICLIFKHAQSAVYNVQVQKNYLLFSPLWKKIYDMALICFRSQLCAKRCSINLSNAVYELRFLYLFDSLCITPFTHRIMRLSFTSITNLSCLLTSYMKNSKFKSFFYTYQHCQHQRV